MHYRIEGWSAWWMLFMALGMLLFWGAVIGMVVWGIRSMSGPNGRPSESRRPLQIAQRRYAQGEITLQEFKAINTGLGLGNPRRAGDALQRASRS